MNGDMLCCAGHSRHAPLADVVTANALFGQRGPATPGPEGHGLRPVSRGAAPRPFSACGLEVIIPRSPPEVGARRCCRATATALQEERGSQYR